LAFDFGLVLDGYCSDFGRTIYMGEPSKSQQRIHKVVMDAQAEAIKAMKAGQITAEGLDMVARNVITDAGFNNNEFFHRLGHGIGIDTHEFPYLNYGYDVTLQENMCFTIEPSILTDKYWTRVEDIVVVTKDKGVKLNNSPGVHNFIVIE
jgi:Xaa-Pro aminopeptidase